MIEEASLKGAQIAKCIDRRSLIGGDAVLSAAVAMATTPGIWCAAAQQAKSDESPPPAAGNAKRKAVSSMKTWVGTLAMQAATYAAPIVAMYNLRATVSDGPQSQGEAQRNLARRGTSQRRRSLRRPA